MRDAADRQAQEIDRIRVSAANLQETLDLANVVAIITKADRDTTFWVDHFIVPQYVSHALCHCGVCLVVFEKRAT